MFQVAVRTSVYSVNRKMSVYRNLKNRLSNIVSEDILKVLVILLVSLEYPVTFH